MNEKKLTPAQRRLLAKILRYVADRLERTREPPNTLDRIGSLFYLAICNLWSWRQWPDWPSRPLRTLYTAIHEVEQEIVAVEGMAPQWREWIRASRAEVERKGG